MKFSAFRDKNIRHKMKSGHKRSAFVENITIFLAFLLTKAVNTGKNLSGTKSNCKDTETLQIKKTAVSRRRRFLCAV